MARVGVIDHPRPRQLASLTSLVALTLLPGIPEPGARAKTRYPRIRTNEHGFPDPRRLPPTSPAVKPNSRLAMTARAATDASALRLSPAPDTLSRPTQER